MIADQILFADGANVTREGKLNVLGEFNVIFSRQVPAVWPMMTIAIRLECSVAEGPQHVVGLRFLNADGEIVSPNFETVVDMGRTFQPGHPHRHLMIIPLANALFPDYGTYEFEVLSDGVRVGVRQIHVLEFPGLPASQA